MMPKHSDLLGLVPTPAASRIDWPSIWALWPDLPALDDCPQDPIHHAEGHVGRHTRMVTEALIAHPDWRASDEEARSVLFWTAVLHDVGKPVCTVHDEHGRITSKGHSRVGAAIARRLLWEAEAPFHWREAVCGLIAAHQLPFWLIEREDPARLAVQTSWRCRPDWLCLHAEADAMGRVCDDQAGILENVALARAQFEEVGAPKAPFPFANDESRVAFFEREDRDPHFAAHEEFRCVATVMSGLPGAGKDCWIARHMPEAPIVSLDAIRKETGVKPTGDQGKVIQLAQERAREHLRAGRDFVWNATNVTRQNRGRTLRLLRDYGARIEIVYLEPTRKTLIAQNKQRADAVPTGVIEKLTAKLEPPSLEEAHAVHVFIADD